MLVVVSLAYGMIMSFIRIWSASEKVVFLENNSMNLCQIFFSGIIENTFS